MRHQTGAQPNKAKAIEAPENGIAWDYCAFIVHIATAFMAARPVLVFILKAL